MSIVHVGDKVKDTVSDFEGVVTCIHSYLNGCDWMSVQPKIDKEGILPEERTFDEPQLNVLRAAAVKPALVPVGAVKTGGPERSMPSAKSTGGQ